MQVEQERSEREGAAAATAIQAKARGSLARQGKRPGAAAAPGRGRSLAKLGLAAAVGVAVLGAAVVLGGRYLNALGQLGAQLLILSGGLVGVMTCAPPPL